MRVLVAPETFHPGRSALDVATALADGWRDVAPGDELVLRPQSDGGPGFLDALPAGRRFDVPTVDPLGRPVTGEVLVTGGVAYLEGPSGDGVTSYGVGILVTAAVETGVQEVVVGLGGRAPVDGGAGLLAALDAAPLDAAGYALPYGGAALAACAGLGGVPRLRDARLVAATDVDNPLTGLHGVSSVFGPQDGADRAAVLLLDAALERFAAVLERDLPGCPAGLAALPGGGAAGGLGAALLALGARRESGTGLVRRLSGLDAALDAADLVITGTGVFDDRSLRGTAVAVVAEAARDRGLPCVAIAGEVAAGRREAARTGVTAAYPLPADGPRALGARLARQWSR
jgi:glycerate kinase